jgi:hypothetical protein
MNIDSQLFRSNPCLPQVQDKPVDLRCLNEAVQKGDVETIIKSRDLFLAKFFTVFAEKREKNNKYFDVKIDGNRAHIEGMLHIIDEVKTQVELFRKLAAEALEMKTEVGRILIPVLRKLFLRSASQEPIDLTDWHSLNVKDKIDQRFFWDYVKPYLSDFLQSLGYHYSESKTTQLAEIHENSPPENTNNVTAIRIAPKQERHFVYQIKPAEVSPSKHPGSDFYDFYKQGIRCDYQLKSCEGTVFKVHSIVLAIYGGPYFQSLFSDNMKEMKEVVDNTINLSFSKEVLQSVVDYIYLGPKSLEDRLLKGEETDVYGILQFAHAYQLTSLFKKSVNLLILSAEKNDYETVETMANLYKDEDLLRFADHLKLVRPQNVMATDIR